MLSIERFEYDFNIPTYFSSNDAMTLLPPLALDESDLRRELSTENPGSFFGANFGPIDFEVAAPWTREALSRHMDCSPDVMCDVRDNNIDENENDNSDSDIGTHRLGLCGGSSSGGPMLTGKSPMYARVRVPEGMQTIANGVTVFKYGTFCFDNMDVWQFRRRVWIPAGFHSQYIRHGICFDLRTFRGKDMWQQDVLEYRLNVCEAGTTNALFEGTIQGVDEIQDLATRAVCAVLDVFPGLAVHHRWSRNGFNSPVKCFGLYAIDVETECRRQRNAFITRKREREAREEEDNDLNDRLKKRLGFCLRDNAALFGRDVVMLNQAPVDIDLVSDSDSDSDSE